MFIYPVLCVIFFISHSFFIPASLFHPSFFLLSCINLSVHFLSFHCLILPSSYPFLLPLPIFLGQQVLTEPQLQTSCWYSSSVFLCVILISPLYRAILQAARPMMHPYKTGLLMNKRSFHLQKLGLRVAASLKLMCMVLPYHRSLALIWAES